MPWSFGQIFYTCPSHKKDGSGCSFWFWEEEYMRYLEQMEQKNPGSVSRELGVEDKAQDRGGSASSMLGIALALLSVGREIACLLKAIVVVCVLVVFVLVMLLFVQLKK
ncbi:hypothetical protein ACP70R_023051 [Stipagrostis hirtigluma subsp. patula]